MTPTTTDTRPLPLIGDWVRIPGIDKPCKVEDVWDGSGPAVVYVKEAGYACRSWQPLPPLTPEELRGLSVGDMVVVLAGGSWKAGTALRLNMKRSDSRWIVGGVPLPDPRNPVALWERAEPVAEPALLCACGCTKDAHRKPGWLGRSEACGLYRPVVPRTAYSASPRAQRKAWEAFQRRREQEREPQVGDTLTVEQLEALPEGSVVRDRYFANWKMNRRGSWDSARNGLNYTAPLVNCNAPITLVRRGPEPAPAGGIEHANRSEGIGPCEGCGDHNPGLVCGECAQRLVAESAPVEPSPMPLVTEHDGVMTVRDREGEKLTIDYDGEAASLVVVDDEDRLLIYDRATLDRVIGKLCSMRGQLPETTNGDAT